MPRSPMWGAAVEDAAVEDAAVEDVEVAMHDLAPLKKQLQQRPPTKRQLKVMFSVVALGVLATACYVAIVVTDVVSATARCTSDGWACVRNLKVYVDDPCDSSNALEVAVSLDAKLTRLVPVEVSRRLCLREWAVSRAHPAPASLAVTSFSLSLPPSLTVMAWRSQTLKLLNLALRLGHRQLLRTRCHRAGRECTCSLVEATLALRCKCSTWTLLVPWYTARWLWNPWRPR